MAEFVKKTTLGGYKPVAGGSSDSECTHAILTLGEYAEQQREIFNAQQAIKNIKFEAEQAAITAKRMSDQAIYDVQLEAQNRMDAAEQEAAEKIKKLKEALAAERQESAHQRALNANLLRINRERANAERDLKPKKEHTGYIVLYSEEKDYPYRQDGKLCRARLWETILQSPYPAELAEATARRQLEEELFPEEDEWLSAKLGITGRYCESYEKMRVEMKQEPENPFFQGNVALAAQQRLKRNFRSGYWEAMLVHTKPLSVVPPDMRVDRG